MKEEVEFVNRGDTAIDDCPRPGVAIGISPSGISGIKSRVMPFTTYDYRELGPVLNLKGVEFLESGLYGRQFFFDDDRKLALTNSVNYPPNTI